MLFVTGRPGWAPLAPNGCQGARPLWCQYGITGVFPPKTQKSTPHLLHRPNIVSVRVDPYAHSHHIKVPKHFVCIQYGCGVQSEAFCTLNHDITTSLRLRFTPKTPKSALNLHRPNSVRRDPYGHSHQIKVTKHFV
jgi:hypothetical protein